MRFIICITLVIASVFAWSKDNIQGLNIIASDSYSVVKLSPDAKKYLNAQLARDSVKISMHNTTDLSIVRQFELTEMFDNTVLVRDIVWLDNQYIGVIITEEFDTDNPLVELSGHTKLFILDSSLDQDNLYVVSNSGYLVNPAIKEPGVFYFARPGRYSKIYKIYVEKLLKFGAKRSKLVRPDGGQFAQRNVVEEVKAYTQRWFFDKDSKAQGALIISFDTISLERELQLVALCDENVVCEQEQSEDGKQEDLPNYKVLKTWSESDFDDDKESPILPISVTNNPNQYYATKKTEDDSVHLYLVDYSTDEQTLIYENQGASIIDIIFNSERELVGVALIDSGELRRVYFNETEQQESDLNTQLKLVLDQNDEQQVSLMYKEDFKNSGEYWLYYDSGAKKLVGRALNNALEVDVDLASTQIVDTVESDGWKIQYLVNLPSQAKNKQAPLIVMPHGGPFGVYDSPYFDSTTQFLVANEYAVLRVNFRGSGGFGQEFYSAGKKQWAGYMIDDISRALSKTLSNEPVAKDKVCVLGMSYGGYAALMLSLRHPDILQCAISVAGVSDLSLFLKNGYLNKTQKKWLREHLGDFEQDSQNLLDDSPVYRLSELDVPIQIIHGEQDLRVNVEQAYRTKYMLDKYNKPHEFHVFEDAGHNFSEPEERFELFSLMIDFLNKHLKESH